MRNALLFLLLPALVLTPGGMLSQDSDASFKWWSEALESNSLEDVLSSLEGGEYRWPSLPSTEKGDDRDWIMLSKNFIVLLAKHIRENRDSDPAHLVGFASEYFSIESALRKSEGYTNQVIGNVYATYGVNFLASAVAQDSSLHDEILKLLETRKSNKPVSVRRFLLEYLQHDPLLNGHREAIQQIGEDVDKNLILAGMRLQELVPALAEASPPSTTFGLIEEPAVSALLSRITLVEYATTTLLPGLIHFIDLGGELDDLVKGSEKPLREVLGDDVYNYKYELLGVRSISGQAVMNLLEDAQGEGQDKILLE
jgi:hypothetical protein